MFFCEWGGVVDVWLYVYGVEGFCIVDFSIIFLVMCGNI